MDSEDIPIFHHGALNLNISWDLSIEDTKTSNPAILPRPPTPFSKLKPKFPVVHFASEDEPVTRDQRILKRQKTKYRWRVEPRISFNRLDNTDTPNWRKNFRPPTPHPKAMSSAGSSTADLSPASASGTNSNESGTDTDATSHSDGSTTLAGSTAPDVLEYDLDSPTEVNPPSSRSGSVLSSFRLPSPAIPLDVAESAAQAYPYFNCSGPEELIDESCFIDSFPGISDNDRNEEHNSDNGSLNNNNEDFYNTDDDNKSESSVNNSSQIVPQALDNSPPSAPSNTPVPNNGRSDRETNNLPTTFPDYLSLGEYNRILILYGSSTPFIPTMRTIFEDDVLEYNYPIEH